MCCDLYGGILGHRKTCKQVKCTKIEVESSVQVRDRMRNKDLCQKLGVAAVEKLKQHYFRGGFMGSVWFVSSV